MMMARLKIVAAIMVIVPFATITLAAQGATDGQSPRRMTSWLASSRNFQVGEIVTIFVDERSLAEEQTSRIATSDRGQSASLSSGGDFSLGVTSLTFSTGMDRSSRSRGEMGRTAGLRGVMSARITEVAPNGVLKIEGQKLVLVDGREQSWTIVGYVRSEDVSAGNEIPSSRIAGGTISYNGQSINPSTGILGKILGIFWP